MNAEIPIPFDALGILRQDVCRRMGYGEAEPDVYTRTLLDRLLEEAPRRVRAAFYYRILPCRVLSDGIEAGNMRFHTEKKLARLLRHSEKIAVFAATAGNAFQRWTQEVSAANDPLELYVLDALGSCIAESAGDYMERQLENESGHLKHTSRFSPGYCNWPVSDQHRLFALLPPSPCGIRLNASSLMIPVKSISGVIGIGEEVTTRTYGCHICDDKHCYLRGRKKSEQAATRKE